MKKWGTVIKTLSFLILFSVSLFATDFVKIYQEDGIATLEKHLDETLADPKYWLEKLQDKNVSYGLYSNYSELLFCNKNEGNFTRVRINDKHALRVESHISTLTGGGKGDKQREGDLRTPLGVYFLKSRIEHPDPFYGPLALVTNYPNNYDLVQDKNGSGIWIHGHPLEGERDSYTKGCLVIDNNELVNLNKTVDFHKAALVISSDNFPVTNKKTIASILSNLFLWRNYWKDSKLKDYLDFYNAQFKRSNGLSLTQFSIMKQHVFSNKVKKHISFHNISVIPYPNEEKRLLFYISFIEKYDSGHVHFYGKKELYIELIDNQISILTES